jgi:hypothetical protein
LYFVFVVITFLYLKVVKVSLIIAGINYELSQPRHSSPLAKEMSLLSSIIRHSLVKIKAFYPVSKWQIKVLISMTSLFGYQGVGNAYEWMAIKFLLSYAMAYLTFHANLQPQKYPHLIMTSDVDWDPATHDNFITIFIPSMTPKLIWLIIATLMIVANYRHRKAVTHNTYTEPEYFDVNEYPAYSDMIDGLLDAHHPAVLANTYLVYAVESSPTP